MFPASNWTLPMAWSITKMMKLAERPFAALRVTMAGWQYRALRVTMAGWQYRALRVTMAGWQYRSYRRYNWRRRVLVRWLRPVPTRRPKVFTASIKARALVLLLPIRTQPALLK